jgi:hypothetical protein
MQVRCKILQSEKQETINSLFSNGAIFQRWKKYIIERVYETTMNLPVIIIEIQHCYQLLSTVINYTNITPSSSLNCCKNSSNIRADSTRTMLAKIRFRILLSSGQISKNILK